jgi:hypothetical protein
LSAAPFGASLSLFKLPKTNPPYVHIPTPIPSFTNRFGDHDPGSDRAF